MLTRRRVAVLTAGLGLSPAAARGQAPKRIGLIATVDPKLGSDALRGALAVLGHVEGQGFRLEGRGGGGDSARLSGLAAELIALPVDMIATIGAVTVRAVRQVSATIPLLFTVAVDPVAAGLVPDARRPGGQTSGVTNFDPAQPLAQMRLLKQLVPGLSRVAILGDGTLGVQDPLLASSMAAAEAEGVRPQALLLRGPDEDLEGVFARIRAEQAEAIVGTLTPTVFLHARRIVAMATAARLPTLYGADMLPAAPLLAHGSSLIDGVRRMAGQVDRFLKGASVGDLPIEVMTEHALVVNLGVARAMGLAVPREVLARASRIIE